MSANHAEIAERFVRHAPDSNKMLFGDRRSNVFPSYNGRELYSYGRHFVLARLQLDQDGPSYWLVNSDTYSSSTSKHQSTTRSALRNSPLPSILLPFSALREAHIEPDSITPVDIQKDGVRREMITVAVDDLPHDMAGHPHTVYHGDGTATFERVRHVMGESVFTAEYVDTFAYRDEHGQPQAAWRTAYFVSAFDTQESGLHYFLAQLPDGATPTTVDEAIESLKPGRVARAKQLGLDVVRQGDVFATEVDSTTRELARRGATFGSSHAGNRLLGLSHAATRIAVLPDGTTYAKGILWHKPQSRFGWDTPRPEHRRQQLGDRQTWYRVEKNTVPVDYRGENRAWSRGGSVD